MSARPFPLPRHQAAKRTGLVRIPAAAQGSAEDRKDQPPLQSGPLGTLPPLGAARLPATRGPQLARPGRPPALAAHPSCQLSRSHHSLGRGLRRHHGDIDYSADKAAFLGLPQLSNFNRHTATWERGPCIPEHRLSSFLRLNLSGCLPVDPTLPSTHPQPPRARALGTQHCLPFPPPPDSSSLAGFRSLKSHSQGGYHSNHILLRFCPRPQLTVRSRSIHSPAFFPGTSPPPNQEKKKKELKHLFQLKHIPANAPFSPYPCAPHSAVFCFFLGGLEMEGYGFSFAKFGERTFPPAFPAPAPARGSSRGPEPGRPAAHSTAPLPFSKGSCKLLHCGAERRRASRGSAGWEPKLRPRVPAQAAGAVRPTRAPPPGSLEPLAAPRPLPGATSWLQGGSPRRAAAVAAAEGAE